jgi:hypothetical protein
MKASGATVLLAAVAAMLVLSSFIYPYSSFIPINATKKEGTDADGDGGGGSGDGSGQPNEPNDQRTIVPAEPGSATTITGPAGSNAAITAQPSNLTMQPSNLTMQPDDIDLGQDVNKK